MSKAHYESRGLIRSGRHIVKPLKVPIQSSAVLITGEGFAAILLGQSSKYKF